MSTDSRPRRRGRPAASDGQTRQRILDAARACFAESGYAGTSTHLIAARTGLTTGALYHHFGGKRDLFLSTLDQVQTLFSARFEAAIAPHDRFTDMLEAMLDEAARVIRDDPTLAGFMQFLIAELPHHPDLRSEVDITRRLRDGLFQDLVEVGIATGEVASKDRRVTAETVAALVAGVLAVGNLFPGRQAHVVGGVKRLIRGDLIAIDGTADAEGGGRSKKKVAR